MKIRLPDGKVLDMPEGATAAIVAAAIGPGLARAAVAARTTVSGRAEIVDLARPLPGDCELSILTTNDEDSESLSLLRHSAAHVMAEAVCKLFPEAKLVYGPPLEDGFYYDLDLNRSITPDDFGRIEEEMTRIVREDRPFRRYELSRSAAVTKLRDEGNRYKVDNADRAEGDCLSFYVTGEQGRDFEDLCRGPHIPSTGFIKAFKIKQVSRSHYRGDVNNQPLQRLYGTAFFKKESLAKYLTQLEEAKRRDHRTIGRELNLFEISDRVGGGLVLWLPHGAVIRTQLQNYLTAEMLKLGYELVYTPHIASLSLYRRSGHFPYYEDSQYPAMFESDRGKAIQSALQLAKSNQAAPPHDAAGKSSALHAFIAGIQQAWGLIEGYASNQSLDETIQALYAALSGEHGYLLRPMNCPHHISIYASRPRSYRDLPVRLAEYGTVYRFEQSGEIGGLTRVRGFTQDDAHLFCTPEQVQDEMLATLDLTRRVLEVMGMTDYRVRLSLRDPASDKYVGTEENWILAEAAIRNAARESGIPHFEAIGEAAFYGPKIDFLVKDCLGRSWQLGTVQADYVQPGRFDLQYIGADNRPHVPVMIHRAPFGAMERFVGILIEHFAGAFPMWLSPVQVAVATVSEKSETYARKVADTLRGDGFRVQLDTTSEKIGPKKHRLRSVKINYILVVGEAEAASETVDVNDRDGGGVGKMPLAQFIAAAHEETRSHGRNKVGA